jgi:hypothetical protein
MWLWLTTTEHDARYTVWALLLLAGIVLELDRNAMSAVPSVAAFLLPLAGWIWDAARDKNLAMHEGEYETTLLIFVLPCLAVATVDCLLYVSALRKLRAVAASCSGSNGGVEARA